MAERSDAERLLARNDPLLPLLMALFFSNLKIWRPALRFWAPSTITPKQRARVSPFDPLSDLTICAACNPSGRALPSRPGGRRTPSLPCLVGGDVGRGCGEPDQWCGSWLTGERVPKLYHPAHGSPGAGWRAQRGARGDPVKGAERFRLAACGQLERPRPASRWAGGVRRGVFSASCAAECFRPVPARPRGRRGLGRVRCG